MSKSNVIRLKPEEDAPQPDETNWDAVVAIGTAIRAEVADSPRQESFIAFIVCAMAALAEENGVDDPIMVANKFEEIVEQMCIEVRDGRFKVSFAAGVAVN